MPICTSHDPEGADNCMVLRRLTLKLNDLLQRSNPESPKLQNTTAIPRAQDAFYTESTIFPNEQYSGYFVTTNSPFGNSILPVIPRIDSTDTLQ